MKHLVLAAAVIAAAAPASAVNYRNRDAALFASIFLRCESPRTGAIDFEKMDTQNGVIQMADLDGRLVVEEVTHWTFNQRTETDAFGYNPHPVRYLSGAQWGGSSGNSFEVGQDDRWFSRKPSGVWRCTPITPDVWPPAL
jgi:hypothetical protein